MEILGVPNQVELASGLATEYDLRCRSERLTSKCDYLGIHRPRLMAHSLLRSFTQGDDDHFPDLLMARPRPFRMEGRTNASLIDILPIRS